MTRGRFITFEGGEGAGKTTQVKLLASTLAKAGIDAMATREPGGAPGAEAIRTLLVSGEIDRWDAMSEALLHSAARREHLVKSVWPALDKGVWVISDRFADSTMAYQGFGQGVGGAAVDTLYGLVVGDFRPDLTLILDLPAADGLRRATARGGDEDRYERLDLDFHERLRQAFRSIAENQARRCLLIDASGSVEQAHQAIVRAVADRLNVSL